MVARASALAGGLAAEAGAGKAPAQLTPAIASRTNCGTATRYRKEPAFRYHFNSTHSSACSEISGEKLEHVLPRTSAGMKLVNLALDWEKPLILIIRQLRRSRAAGVRGEGWNRPASWGRNRPLSFGAGRLPADFAKSRNSLHPDGARPRCPADRPWYPVVGLGLGNRTGRGNGIAIALSGSNSRSAPCRQR